ncbi:MAG: hypothetical protein GW772_09310 [Flavobacteriia bacterium]|nr:hypothetical protein [Flavobacteriia bacterium]OIP46265.1 MAG: hypothetical protein AUK46_08570 [Flavobacteriaceae bacterium CG2_30_31_66]PIV95955.1 MAG: hypothetical protein COW43_10865 [Flavobacteriaceae bacterium CG17_big_fil_post_rev_8_21_14_2_50_31_13]PIX13565.1 MAG: hypothetical protein COZ74_05585 [Flavobacteriaceae bacterium CG_4_8_14_3_um_filter_31_8]PIY16290.1 MAG: hypothetical protein COZ16_00575 [Flavobacteriaceae bacterium CG_4_10_14_3_um_filter_31_253]PIZ11951.1 MAG: hypotheti
MKVLIDIKESKVPFVLELLNSLQFIKMTPITEEKAALISDLREAVGELKLIRQGKMKGISAKELIDDL